MILRRFIMAAALSVLTGFAFSLASAITIVAAAPVTLAMSSNADIALSAEPTRVVLMESVSSGEINEVGRRIFLVVDGLFTNLPPGTTYDVFLGVPEHIKPRREDPGYAGTLNFFDVPVSRGSGDGHSVAFDVTSVLQRLRAAGRSPLTVTLAPKSPPYEEAKPFVGQIKLVAE